MGKFTIVFVDTTLEEFLRDWVVENKVSMKEPVERKVSIVPFIGRSRTTNSTLLIVL